MENLNVNLPIKLNGRIVVQQIPMSFLQSDFAKNHRRLSIFVHKGLNCIVPGCNHSGSILIQTVQINRNGSISGYHIDLYTNNFMLMTIDHKIALSLGGLDDFSNKFPMCEYHNSKKGRLSPKSFYSEI